MFLVPLARFRLEAQHETVRIAEVRQVRSAISIEVSNSHRGDIPVDRNLDMLKPPVTADLVDVPGVGSLLPVRRRLALQQKIDAAVTVVDHSEIGPSVVVEVSGEHGM